jgi:tetratricopeptide (TPR) repeat protein
VTSARRASALLVACLVGLGACAGAVSRTETAGALTGPPAAPTPAPDPTSAPAASARERLAARHNAQAEKLEQEGWLRQALDERLIALTIDPDNQAAQGGRKRLEGRIERGVADHIREGRAALARGSVIEARRRFLVALALDPTNRAAFETLQTEAREVEFITHTVRAGDTLPTLGQRYYGDASRAEVIGETNQLPVGARLVAGRTLKIPEIPGLPFHRAEPRRELARDVTARPDASPPASPRGEPLPRSESVKEEPPEVNPLLLEAREALERNDYTTALADLDKLLRGSPGHADGLALKKQLLYRQGRAQLEAKRYTESYRTLRQLAAIAPEYENSASLVEQARRSAIDQHYGQGIRLYREEKLREAIAEWRIVLDLDPQHTNARRNIEQAERLLKGLEDRRKR